LGVLQAIEIDQSTCPIGWGSTGQFTKNHGMHHYTVALQQIDQSLVLASEMIDPYRSINQYTIHASAGSCRRRGISGICGASPPRAASRFADCTRTYVLTASRIRSAFSIPGSATCSALSNNASSIVTVVRIVVSINPASIYASYYIKTMFAPAFPPCARTYAPMPRSSNKKPLHSKGLIWKTLVGAT